MEKGLSNFNALLSSFRVSLFSSYLKFSHMIILLPCIYGIYALYSYKTLTYHFIRFSSQSFESLVTITYLSLYYSTASYERSLKTSTRQLTTLSVLLWFSTRKTVRQEHWVLMLTGNFKLRVTSLLCLSLCIWKLGRLDYISRFQISLSIKIIYRIQ